MLRPAAKLRPKQRGGSSLEQSARVCLGVIVGAKGLRGEVRIKIVNVATTEAEFPVDISSGHSVSAKTPAVEIRDGATVSMVRQDLQRQMALQIVRLFRKWEQQEVNE